MRKISMVVCAVAALVLGACGKDATPTAARGADTVAPSRQSSAESVATSTTATAPTSTQALPTTTAPSATGGPTRPDDAAGPYPVVEVVDGDTIKVQRDGTRTTLRLIGIDTPETKDPRKPVQCFGREASAHASELLSGTSVWITADPTQDAIDKYGRTLVYVWLPDGRSYNWLMIEDGYAHEYTYDIPYRYMDAFKAAERDARENDRGLWSPTTCAGDTTKPADANAAGPSSTAAVSPTAPPTSAAAAAPAACDPNYTGACVPPYPPDVDCKDIPAKNTRPRHPTSCQPPEGV